MLDIEDFYSDYDGNIINLINNNNKITIVNKDFEIVNIKNKHVPKHCLYIIFVYNNKSIIVFQPENSYRIFKDHNIEIFNYFNNKINSESVKLIYRFWRLHCKDNTQDGV